MVHCAWCGKNLQNHPPKYVWANQLTLEIGYAWGVRRVCFCSDEHKQKWIAAEQIDFCIVCYNAVKDTPIVKKVEKARLIYYFCEEHQLDDEYIDHYLDVITEDIVHLK